MKSQMLRDTRWLKTFTPVPLSSAATETHAEVPLSPVTCKEKVLGALCLRWCHDWGPEPEEDVGKPRLPNLLEGNLGAWGGHWSHKDPKGHAGHGRRECQNCSPVAYT